jgi:glycosyltransferase involved in cell wall biosynthesis
VTLKISIVTPNYNYESFIETTITSVVNQNWTNIEHIIVDDGSTDNSVEKVNNLIKRYPGKIRLIRQENHGQTHAINTGLKEAVGNIIGWINSDDSFCQNVFSEIVNCFEKDPELDIVFSDINVVDLKLRRIYRKRFLNFNPLFGKLFGFTNIMSSNAFFFRKEILLSVGLLDEDLVCNMDGEFFSRLTQKRKVKKLPFPISNFRRQPFTKASPKYKDWNSVIKMEYQKELGKSYESLSISKIVPYKYSFIIKIWFRIYRIILRMILLHYFLEASEKLNYRFRK